MPAHPLRHGRWLRRARLGALLLVLAASLGGVVAVGLGETWRGYSRLQFERLAAQGAVIQGPVEMLLRVGVSLEQFTGFANLARALREADPTLEELRIIDAQGRVLFSEPPGLESHAPTSSRALALPHTRFEVREDARTFRVALPLANRFGTVGHLELVMSRQAVSQRVLQRFQPIFTVLGLCLLFQTAFLLGAQRLWMRRPRRWLGVSFGVSFVGLAFVTSLALVDLYSEGLQQGTSSLAHSLARRLNEAARLGLSLSHLRGLDTLLQDYQRSNADLGSLALIADERVLIHAGASPGGSEPERFEYAIDLELTEGPWGLPVRLEVGAAQGALHGRLWRSCRNFLFLFAASGLLGLLVLKALTPLPQADARRQAFERRAVDRLHPLAFFACFLEGLHLAFLPGYAEGLNAGGGAALLAIAFHGARALALLPAAHYARSARLDRWLGGALLVSAAPVFLMALTEDFRLWLLLRGLSGLGQGALAAGLQAYLLAVFHPKQSSPRTSLLVPAHHGGLLGGTVVGALLAAHLGTREVFLFAGLCGLAALAYTLLFLPPLEARDGPDAQQPFRATLVWRNLHPSPPRAWDSRAHHQAMLLVGLPTLLIRGGAICFALPLLLAGRGYDVDRIGQLLALYALGVLLSHQLLSARAGWTRRLLQGGMLGTGVALFSLAASGELELSCALSVGVLGLSHGLIHAPLERHLSSLPGDDARKRAFHSVAPLIGGLGQCLGPVLVSALLSVQMAPLQVLGALGVMALVLGAAFSWTTRGLAGREVRHA